MRVEEVIKMGIIWDEKSLANTNSEELQAELASIYAQFRKGLTETSVPSGSLFIGLATESDAELIKSLFNLPSELRLGLLEYIQTYFNTVHYDTMKETKAIDYDNSIQNKKIKDLLLGFPHKDLEIIIDRPLETGRDLQI
jgi:hypothetical protein